MAEGGYVRVGMEIKLISFTRYMISLQEAFIGHFWYNTGKFEMGLDFIKKSSFNPLLKILVSCF